MNKTETIAKKESDAKYVDNNDIKIAIDTTTRIEEHYKQQRKKLLENAAEIISFFAIFLTIILFAYNKGYSSVFNIPTRCIPLNLKSYVPVAYIVCSMSIYAFLYSAEFRKDLALNKNRINPMRILYGTHILYYTFYEINIYYYLGMIWSCLISIIISVIIELVVFLLRRPRKENKTSKAEFNLMVEDFIFNRVFFFLFYKTGIWIIVFPVILTPFIGEFSAKINTKYETCVYESEQYSVVVDYGERVLVQKALVEDNTLTIYTDTYTFIPRDGTVFVFNHYDSVDIVADSPTSPCISDKSEQHEG